MDNIQNDKSISVESTETKTLLLHVIAALFILSSWNIFSVSFTLHVDIISFCAVVISKQESTVSHDKYAAFDVVCD